MFNDLNPSARHVKNDDVFYVCGVGKMKINFTNRPERMVQFSLTIPRSSAYMRNLHSVNKKYHLFTTLKLSKTALFHEIFIALLQP